MPAQRRHYSWEQLPKSIRAAIGRLSTKLKPRGCEQCPLNKSGIVKVIRLKYVVGRKAMLWGMCPGEYESQIEKELVGPSGVFLWKRAAKVGLKRTDFDIQNVVRCRTTELVTNKWGKKRLTDREPDKVEAHCCSIYTEKALVNNKGHAVVHLVLGQFAAKTLLGKEYRKDHPIFWSERLNAKVICIPHPAYFLRGGNRTKLEEFMAGLRAVKEAISGKSTRFSYLEKQDYKDATHWREAEGMLTEVEREGYNTNLSVDIEYGVVKGKRVVLTVGISYKPGLARVFHIDHPEQPAPKPERDRIVARLKQIFENPKIHKTFHKGSGDIAVLYKRLGIRVQGYTFDSMYAEYLAFSSRRAFGLTEIAYNRFHEFVGYKDIIAPYVGTPVNYARIPKRIMRLYNGADCDISKRIELSTVKRVDKRLLQVYMDAGFTVDAMEHRGPFVDLEYLEKLYKIIPPYTDHLKNKLRVLTGDPGLNPNSVPQMAHYMYDVLKLPMVIYDKFGNPTRSTGKEALELLADAHELPRVFRDYKGYEKIDTTYLPAYKRSAELHNGHLRTQWWLTGGITGRLRSGGGKEGIEKGIVNMQNLHGAPMLKNALVSDLKWRRAVKAVNWHEIENLSVFLVPDYSQSELRCLAHMSGDPLMISQFRAGLDIHAAVVHELVGWSIEEVMNNEELRVLGKNIHFGVVFGLSEDGLVDYARAKGSKMETELIKSAYRKYFKKYKGVAAFQERMQTFADEHGYVDSIFGFRREINKYNSDRSTFWGNQAINSPIQNGSHTLMLIIMAILKQKPRTYALLHELLAEVHDAFYFSAPFRQVVEAYAQVKQLMEVDVLDYVKQHFDIEYKVPLVVDAKVGFRMGAMVKRYTGQQPGELLTMWQTTNKKVEAEINAELAGMAA